ncbi:hypothetical protein PVOR_13904 [Paenibacillus vortex V453]|uniref:Uncharacterized protein n=1 Tax=Paenibacillus vortex V453 TaxID=715225 RepID=A0A2R9SVV1_9BACL|nr:hypothetical protein PVOR_13904 [Paenibacillus vortex V453]
MTLQHESAIEAYEKKHGDRLFA